MAHSDSFGNRRRWLSHAARLSASSFLCGDYVLQNAYSALLAGMTVDVRMQVEGRNRSYLLYLPCRYDDRSAWPMVVALHPYLYPNRVFERYARLKSAADRDGFLLVMPQGFGRGIFRSFNAGLRDDPNDPDDVQFTAAVLNDVQSRVTVDHTRIYAIGMSNGGMFTHVLAQEMPGLFAGIVTVAGSPAEPIRSGIPPTPVMMVHGTSDPITPWTGPGKNTPRFLNFQSVTESFAQWCAVNGVAGPADVMVYDQPGDRTRVVRYQWTAPANARADTVLLRIEGGGHRWPADVRRPFIPFTGKQSTDMDFNQLAWEFLSRQRRV